jgi:hypothetical protein
LLSRAPVRLDATLAVSVYDFVRRVSLPLNERWTAVPGIGFARLVRDRWWTRVEWRTPLRLPSERLAYDLHGQLNVAPFYARSARGYPDEQAFHSSPVQTWTDPVGAPMGEGISSVNVTVGRPVDRLRRDLSIPDLRLSDWVMAR